MVRCKKTSSLWAIALLGLLIFLLSGTGVCLVAHAVSQDSPLPETSVGLPIPPDAIGRDAAVTATLPDTAERGAEACERVAAPVIVLETIQKGETASSILQPYLTPGQIQAMTDVCEPYFSLHRLRVGKPYELTIDQGKIIKFVYEIDAEKKLIVETDGNAFTARLETIVYEVVIRHVQGTITSHLFQAVADAGEAPALAVTLAEIFAWEINFIRDIHPGDSFRLLVEKRYRNGEFKGYGRILAASFTNQDVPFEAFGFRDADGFPHYYNAKGESVKRAFLKAPLSFTRISSKFSPKRLHPILHVWRAHPGVDYAAPTGTPVKAVGSGTVTFKGSGRGAGNYVAIRHNNQYETMYLHLSRFAKGLQKGKKVEQGEVIGFVGSTGYATGPHLDFRMKKDGVYINPLTITSPRTDPVAKNDMAEFVTLVTSLRQQLGDEGPRRTGDL